MLFFVENAGRVIKKDDLLDELWKDVFIEEGTMARTIQRLRKKLEASGGNGTKIIETLPKRGYRFLPAVVKTDANDALIVEEQTRMRVRIEETTESEFETDDLGFEEDVEPTIKPKQLNPKPQISNFKFLSIIFGIAAIAAIAFIVYQNFFRKPETNTVLASRVKPFSGATGRENTPAFSLDGKQIAFAWDGGDGGDLDIYIRLIGAVEPVRLTDSDFTEQYPTFSPDGLNIAFVRDYGTRGEVVLIPALGGAERKIAKLFSGFASISFAPDGQNIAVIDTENSTEGGQYAVYLINLQNGERRRLTAPAEFVGETTPRFSPDGKSVAFVRVAGDKNQDLFVVPISGGEPRQITFDKTVIHSVSWNADGQEIFFVSYRGGVQPSIWRVPVSGDEEPQMISTSGRDITNLAASPDGKTLAFVENNKNTDIWRVSANQKTPEKFAASIYSEHDPNFSPDGSRVVFASNRTGKYEIWMADADGKNLRPLTDLSAYANVPRFSPDGANVAYSGTTDDNPDIFIVSTELGTDRRLTENPARESSPSWSADGKFVYFTTDRTGENQIWKMPVGGAESEAVQITKGGAFLALPAPDGKTVFYTKANESADLWRVPADGGAEEKLPEFARAGFIKNWTMTRSGIYFIVRDSDQTLKIKFYDFADEKIKDIPGNYKIPENLFGNLDATADGDVFLFSLEDQNASSIMLAELPSIK